MNKLYIYIIINLLLINSVASKEPELVESYNRKMYQINKLIDNSVLKPVSIAYNENVDSAVRSGIRNFSSNIREPWNFINSILQGKPGKAFTSISRFAINSTIGLFGLFDVASEISLESQPESLGETFGVWGYKNSTFIVLPLMGPSTIRDSLGFIGTQMYEPYEFSLSTEYKITFFILNGLEARYNVMGFEDLLYSAPDEYALFRSVYLDSVNKKINDGKVIEEQIIEEEDIDFLLE